jgi:hypothetical protein
VPVLGDNMTNAIPRGKRALLFTACGAIAFALSVSALAAGKPHKLASPTPPGAAQGDCDTPTTPFCDAMMKPPKGWTGHVFKLAQNYPASVPEDAQPWLKIDPKTQGNEYLQAVLDFFYEGNVRPDVEESFDPAQNKIRGWYNAPWQDFGKGGREFIHGLTRERVTPIAELTPPSGKCAQKDSKGKYPRDCYYNNYAVGFYNAPGGMVIGKVWTDHGKPDATLANLPEGTVAAKLLFTTAPADQVPFLAGSPEWDAYVYADPHIQTSEIPDDPAKRVRAVLKVRLLQIDIAVKDKRAGTIGWFMGTFVYGGGPAGKPGSGWSHVSPVGIMWGNDPGYSGTGPLSETVLNPDVHMPHVGYQGRLNGPVDNPDSACLSCHGTAEVAPKAGMKGSGMIASPVGDPKWFRNVPSGTPFDEGFISTDYSLQISVGIANFDAQQSLIHAATRAQKQIELDRKNKLERLSPREGGSID